MTVNEAKALIIKTIVEITETEVEVTEDTNIVKEIGLSSIQTLTMIGDLEDTFDIELKRRKLSKIKTVGELCDCIIDELR